MFLNCWQTTRVSFTFFVLALAILPLSVQAATPWVVGDVFTGVSTGQYQVYDNNGLFKETITQPQGGFTMGCAFNPPLTKLYTTNFSNTKVYVFDDPSTHPVVQTIDTNVTSPGGHSESIVFDAAGNFYVGHPDGNVLIHRYFPDGTLDTTFSVAVDYRGTDWIDLAADQVTLYYTSEGRAIQVYDTSTTTQLANFAVLPGAGNAFALRLLPPGDGSGGLIVADGSNIKRLDGTGTVVQTYDVVSENSWFSLNLDPNGTSFWAGDFGTSNFYRFNIATGNVEVGSINTGTGSSTLFGICVKGELTVGVPDDDQRRMTGGGSVIVDATGIPVGEKVSHGFLLHCNANEDPNNLQVNWGRGNKFHLETLNTAVCTNDPAHDASPPVADFDTIQGTGTGRYNGMSGATVEFTLTDDGEPGSNDWVAMTIKDTGGTTVLDVTGVLNKGNQQAHNQ